MPQHRPNHAQRAHVRDREVYRNAQAKAAAEQREQANPWVQLAARVDAANLPARCRRLVDALRWAWDQLSRTHRPVIWVGYGPDEPKPDQHCLATLAGMSSRTCRRAVRDLVRFDRGLMRDFGGGQQDRQVRIRCYNRRTGEMVNYGHQGPIGRGGRGQANGYWTEGMEGPPDPSPQPEPTRPTPPPAPVPAGPRRMARTLEQQRRDRAAAARGP